MSRFLSRKIGDGQFFSSPAIEFMAEFYRGEGPLYEEIKAVFPPSVHAATPNTLKWFQDLIQYGRAQPESKLPWRKAISAFMYWAISENIDKTERSAVLSTYFGGDSWNGFSIYGRFYPLNLIKKCIYNGHLENYTSLQSCDYSPGKTVFHSTQVNFDDRCLPEKLDRSLFGSDCTYSSSLASSFHARDMAEESGREIIRDNIYRILKVGFRSNRFSWKSKDLYKNATVVGKFSLDAYLTALTGHGVLMLELSRAGAEPGYVVSEGWYLDARKLVEEKNVTDRMSNLISTLPKNIQ
jgi:hypothetical protein